MSPAAEWEPVFPDPQPAHWVAFVNTLKPALTVLSDSPIDAHSRGWLAAWLARYAVAEPSLPASYVYLGLAATWIDADPDGHVSPHAVTGVGSGEGFGEPAGAASSTMGSIVSRSVAELRT